MAWSFPTAHDATIAARRFLRPCSFVRSLTRSFRPRRTLRSAGETVYAITKVDQEKLVLSWGRQTGIPTVALRYSALWTSTMRSHPYTGVNCESFVPLLTTAAGDL